MATHPATTIPNIVLSNYHMINTKDQCPSNVTMSISLWMSRNSLKNNPLNSRIVNYVIQ